MSTVPAAPTSKPRPFFRFWFPWIVLALAGLAVIAIGWSPVTEEWAPANRNVGSVMACVVAGLVLTLWLLFLSGVRWSLRLGVLAIVVAAGFIFSLQIRQLKFTGNMVPIIRFRSEPEPEDLLEQHRAKQPAGTAALVKATIYDFSEYRGKDRAGVVIGPALATDWKASPPRQLWRQPVGGGYSGFAVEGNALVTLEQRRDQEVVVCYDTTTGVERWKHAYPAMFSETLGGNGPRATPTIADGAVFSLGAKGKLVCLDLKNGEREWDADILKGNKNIMWGMSGSPLVYENVVVVNPGAQTPETAGRALVAYDRKTGKEIWHGGNHRAGYSSPMLATLAGRRQIVLFDGEGIGGYDEHGGKELWWHEWKTMNDINVAQPVILDGDRVFVSSAYDVGCSIFRISKAGDEWQQPREEWHNPTSMRCKFTSPVLYQGCLYGLDEGYLVCVDPNNGYRRWKGKNYGHGQLLLSGATLVILSEHGKLVLARATPEPDRKTQNELTNMQAIEGKTWNCFALADGIVYVRNDTEMAAYDLRIPDKK
jgi:outer membrane protein assembly factor BamB